MNQLFPGIPCRLAKEGGTKVQRNSFKSLVTLVFFVIDVCIHVSDGVVYSTKVHSIASV